MVIFLALLPFPIPISFGEDWSSYLLTCTHTYTHTQYTRVEKEGGKEAYGQRKMDDEMREVGGCGHHGGVGDRYNDRDKEPDMLIEAV